MECWEDKFISLFDYAIGKAAALDKIAISPVAIPSETIEQIAAANDIVEVIGSYFPLKRAGANFKALCPFHQEKTPSFHGESAAADVSLFRLRRGRKRFSVRHGLRACRFSRGGAETRRARRNSGRRRARGAGEKIDNTKRGGPCCSCTRKRRNGFMRIW